MPDDERFGLTELADVAGVTPRTVRYYLAQGLLPAVGQSGPGSKYDSGHLARLRLIRRLQTEHLPLSEIRRRMDGLADDDIRSLAGNAAPAPPTESALDYLRSVLAPADPSAPSPAPHAVAERLDEPYAPTPSTSAAAPEAPSAQPIERSQWERIVLASDVELHIRRPLARAQNKQVDRLVTIARELLEEDRP